MGRDGRPFTVLLLVVLGGTIDGLRHGRGHASRHQVVAIVLSLLRIVVKYVVVERVGLVPLGRYRRLHLGAHGFRDGLPDLGCAEGLNLVGIHLQPETHVVGDVPEVKASTVHVAQNLCRAVVARDDDEAVVLADVEHMKRVAEGLGLGELWHLGSGTMPSGGSRCLLLQEAEGFLASIARRHRCSDGAAAEQQGSHHGHHILIHACPPRRSKVY